MVDVFSFQGKEEETGWKTNDQTSQWPASQLRLRGGIVSLPSRNTQCVFGKSPSLLAWTGQQCPGRTTQQLGGC